MPGEHRAAEYMADNGYSQKQDGLHQTVLFLTMLSLTDTLSLLPELL